MISFRKCGLLIVSLLTATLRAAGLVVPDDVIFVRGIEYANPDGQHLKLDLARPKQTGGLLPAVLCLHGGALTHGSREGCDRLCVTLGQHGFVAATISYRLAPTDVFPAALFDAKAAVRWLRAHADDYHLDPARIGVTGGSAGGLLAHLLGVTKGVGGFEGDQNPGFSSDVACVVAYFGPTDFAHAEDRSMAAAKELPLWLGGDLAEARRRAIRASPINWVTPAAAPTLMVHGTADQSVSPEQSRSMRDRLAACGVEVQLLILDGAAHGFKGTDAEKADQALLSFFDSHLKATAHP